MNQHLQWYLHLLQLSWMQHLTWVMLNLGLRYTVSFWGPRSCLEATITEFGVSRDGWFFDFVITSGSGFLKTCVQRTNGFYKRTREIPSRFFDQFFDFVSITIYRWKAVIWSRVCILDLHPLIFFCLKNGRTTQHWFFSSCLKERENHPLLVFTHVCWFFLL